MLNKIHELVDGIVYTRDVPKEAEELAKQTNAVIIVGGSDDLMYCYGSDSYLTDYVEHSYGWDGETFEEIDDKQLEDEANQLGLEIFWCGSNRNGEIEEYNIEKSGAFSYKVKDGIEFKNFIVYENDKKEEVYCTGIIIELPVDFKICKEEE